MTRSSWKKGAYCISAWLGEDGETLELFSKSSFKKVSPLAWRVPILVWSILTTIWSISYFWGTVDKYLIYMTHWGLGFIIFEMIFGIIVAVKKPQGELPDATFGLPWYVKTYWVLYNISIPVSFLITVFYWGLLNSLPKTIVNYSPDPVLDVLVHGVNSFVMMIELVCSAHPSRLLHIMQPLYFAGGYVLFTIIYHVSGGVDPWGNMFIYPVLDWSKPDQTMVVVTLTALFLALMHLLTVAIAKARDAIARKRVRDMTGIYNDGFSS